MKTKYIGALALLLLACGDDLVDGDYAGEPRIVLNGQIQELNDGDPSLDRYLTIVWEKASGDGDISTPQLAPIAGANFPAGFTLALFDPPQRSALNDYGDALLGLGYIAVFNDSDQDGTISMSGSLDSDTAPDLVEGLATSNILLYAPVVSPELQDRLRGGLLLNPEALEPGFNLTQAVCASAQEDFDRLRIIPNDAPITIESMETVLANNYGCLNLF